MAILKGRFCLFVPLYLLALEHVASAEQGYQRYQNSTRFSPNDYILKSYNENHDEVFDGTPQTIDLGLNLGIGSDCGRVNFQETMRSTLKNLLDSKYFGDLGRNIIASSPLLLTCYMSPTWCAILKHTQLSANFLSQMRLNQCALVDKYVDTRTEDYYRERQDCVRQKIADNGGDLEKAMDTCQNVYDADLANWAGKSSGDKTATNKLIESSTKWAGFTGTEADRATDLVKAFVGDIVVGRGNVSVEYGSRQRALTPETHMKELRAETYKKLCDGIIPKLNAESGRQSVEQVVADRVLKSLAPGSSESLVDRQTLEALAYLPPKQQRVACKRLADALSLTVFTKDANRSVDILAIAAQNPNLPPHRREEIETKRRSLKESIDLTLALERERNAPLRNVTRDINEQGERYRDSYSAELLREDESAIRGARNVSVFMDCGDGVMCQGGG